MMTGRGFGKTRTGAETIREWVEPGVMRRGAFVGATAADVRDVMVEGESGILAVSPPWFRPEYEPSKRRLTWPNGAIATMYSADEPNRLRGPQHDKAWADEIASWRYPETWDMLMFGLRLGEKPQVIATTTPKPRKIVRDLISDKTCHVTPGTSYENRVNLSPVFYAQVVSKYEGTVLGEQELKGKLLEEIPGALWTRGRIGELRVAEHPPLERIVVAVDPSATASETSDEAGIVIAGRGVDKHGYILADVSARMTPHGWASQAVTSYHTHKADRVIGEVNNGGDMVETVIRMVDPNVAYKAVHASRGKATRAEPIAALYEQGRVHHVGTFDELEDQMCSWVPGDPVSPDRMDALVWALTELMLNEKTGMIDYLKGEVKEGQDGSERDDSEAAILERALGLAGWRRKAGA